MSFNLPLFCDIQLHQLSLSSIKIDFFGDDRNEEDNVNETENEIVNEKNSIFELKFESVLKFSCVDLSSMLSY
jgi:hypothetical protein